MLRQDTVWMLSCDGGARWWCFRGQSCLMVHRPFRNGDLAQGTRESSLLGPLLLHPQPLHMLPTAA